MSQASSPMSHWFEYFPGNYMWSQAMVMAFGLAAWRAADFGDVDRAGRRLKARAPDNQAWFEEWHRMAREAESRALAAEAKGRTITAGEAFLRAATYYFLGERFLSHEDNAKLAAYRKCLECFERGARRVIPGFEKVEIPYEGSHLSSYFLPPVDSASAPYPTVVFFDGLDICKEITAHYARELTRRGIGCLVVDGPGQGETLRIQGIPSRYNYEVAAGACVDYIEGRRGADSNRIGVMALSMGGYYAPRCAAFEKRFKACVSWGAHYDYHALWVERRKVMESGGSRVSAPRFHLPWVLGVDTMDKAMERLRPFTLKDVARRIECPILICHGECDSIVPVTVAHQLFEEIPHQNKELKIFGAEEGGAEHCQVDVIQIITAFVSDWMSEHL